MFELNRRIDHRWLTTWLLLSGLLLGASVAVADAGVDSVTKLADLHWIAGTWQGAQGESTVEETWSDAAAGAMIGMFRWHDGKSVRLYEFMTIRATDSGIELRIKHFGDDLVGWEPREEAVVFRLHEHRGQRAVFALETADETSYLTYERSDDRLTVVLDKKVGDKESRTTFKFQAR